MSQSDSDNNISDDNTQDSQLEIEKYDLQGSFSKDHRRLWRVLTS